MLTKEDKKRIIEMGARQPITVSATKKKGEEGIAVEIEGNAINVMVVSIDLLRHVGKVLKNTNKDLYAAWVTRLIAALADTATDDDDEDEE